ncbi:50S ribosomal protein L28 [candidate division KSB1 bacterium]|nr:50S ribosomal protein L28 [candidate division KSB1 bacterium]
MSKVCVLTGKKPQVGNNVSHAHNKTRRRWLPNIQKKRIWLAEEERWVRIRLSARALRTVEKKGLMQYLRDEGLKLKDVVA